MSTGLSPRLAGRVERLRQEMDRCAAKLATAPKSPKAKRWKARWLECQQSLVNIRDHGRETLPTGKPAGVEIDVPQAPFAIEQGEG